MTQLNSDWLQACAALDGVDPFVGRRIAKEVAKNHGFTVAELFSRRRERALVKARHLAMYRIRKETELSLPRIGRMFGGRDHTTVLSACRAHQARKARGEV
jgi:chromosomal replication initiation ATPase DnaA